MFEWVENKNVAKGLEILSLPLFQVYKLSRENIQAENICDVVFKITKGRNGTERVLMKKLPSDWFFKKKCYEKFCRTHKKTLALKTRF